MDEALEILKTSRFRVVVCDLSVPASDQLRKIISKEGQVFEKYPGAFAAFSARNAAHRTRQVVIYSVHDTTEIQELANRIGVQYITKGRPHRFKEEIDAILSYDPTKDR